jgi:hypothetical protein
MKKSQYEGGRVDGGGARDTRRLFSGYGAAVLAQVPYTVILYSCFEMFDSMIFSPDLRYERNDEEWFVNKFM